MRLSEHIKNGDEIMTGKIPIHCIVTVGTDSRLLTCKDPVVSGSGAYCHLGNPSLSHPSLGFGDWVPCKTIEIVEVLND